MTASMSRRNFLRYTAAGAASVALAACVSPQQASESGMAPEAAGATLNLWWYGYTDNDMELLDQWYEEFYEENPGIELVFDIQGWRGRREKVYIATAAGEPPDGFWATSDTIESYVVKNVANPLDDAIPQELWEQYGEAALASGTYKGEKYMAPASVEIMGFQHNGNLMEELGHDATWGPETWDELLSLAEEAKSKDYYVDFISTFEWLHWLWAIRSAGGTVYTDDGLGNNMREQPAIDALNLWVTLYENDFVPKEGAAGSPEEASGFRNWFDEQLQMTRNRANCRSYSTNLPEVNLQLSPSRRANMDVAPYAGNGETRAWIITQGSKQKEAAFELVRYCTEPAKIGYFCDLFFAAPASNAAAENWHPEPCELEFREAILADTRADIDSYHFWQESKVVCAPHFQSAVLGLATVEEALDNIATELDELIAEWVEIVEA